MPHLVEVLPHLVESIDELLVLCLNLFSQSNCYGYIRLEGFTTSYFV